MNGYPCKSLHNYIIPGMDSQDKFLPSAVVKKEKLSSFLMDIHFVLQTILCAINMDGPLSLSEVPEH